MQRIATGYVDAQHPKAIDADLYRRYSETLRKAVELVGVDETLQDRWMANVSRFAAYKAADATRRIAEAVMENGALDDGLNPLHAHRRYLAAEANTARTRARTGKQWQQFNDDDRRRLFPNLRWVPSRSAMPREAHQLFWDKVWAKDDPFWQRNQPGTLWNCKCDWEETDDPVSTDEEKKLPNGRSVDDYTIKVRGLDGNPAETGQIFSDDASYVRDCEYGELVEHIYQGISEYDRLTASGDYKEMQFDWSSGAYKGVHKRHNFDKKGGVYEKHVQNAGFNTGHRVILENELGGDFGERFTEGTWDGMQFEVAGRETATVGNVFRGLKHCAEKRTTEIAVLDFPKGGFDEDILQNALKRYRGLEKLNDGQYIQFKKVVCVQDEKIIYEADF